jgi:Holliday junction resolvase RusA-like endonuclease
LTWDRSFFVPGRPQTAGSKQALVNPHSGRATVTEGGTAEVRERKRSWRSLIKDVAEQACAGGHYPTDAPMEVEFVFVLRRPQAHYGSGRNSEVLKPWAAALCGPTVRPDALKMARAAEDSLTGVVWIDDASILDERLMKRYPDAVGFERGVEGLLVRVRVLTV